MPTLLNITSRCYSTKENTILNDSNPFLSPIPSDYIHSKRAAVNVLFYMHEIYYKLRFTDKIYKYVVVNCLYTVFVKIRFNNDSYAMCSNQFGFDFKSDTDISILLDTINAKLNQTFEDYDLIDEDIIWVQLTFKQLDVKLISEFILDKPVLELNMISLPDKDRILKGVNIPVSVNKSSLGNLLETKVDNGYISYIKLAIDNKTINFLDIIKEKAKFLRANHKDNIVSFDCSWRFYFLMEMRSKYVLAIKYINKSTIEKIRYSVDGVVINHVIDSLSEDNLVTRKYGNNEILIKDNKITYYKQNMDLKPIDKLPNKHLFIENPNIGVIDCETYLSNDGITKVYCLGFKTNLSKEAVTYYINNSLNSEEIVLKSVDELLIPKYDKIKFDCHNLGGYDVVFILKVLSDYNDSQDKTKDKYGINCVFRDDKILRITISKTIGKTKNVFSISDSYSILNNSLYKLSVDFKVPTIKGIFPHDFSNENNLFYVGNTPDMMYFKAITVDDYKLINSKDWSFKTEALKYLNDDINCLYQVICKANKQVFIDYNVDMTDNLTISSLALKIFLSKFYDNNIPLLSKPSIYRDINLGYYGGITEVYKPYGENLYYYDVNSLYPYVALQDLPGNKCTKEYYFDKQISIDNCFGFYYCEIDAPLDGYFGLLPVRSNNGLYFPVGKWYGWYFSEELKLAKMNGYKIRVIHGYSFNKVSNVFKRYVDFIYNIKTNPKDSTQKSMAKSLLNNLLGRFGIKIDKPVTKLVSNKKFELLSLMNKVVSYKSIGINKTLLSYIDKLNPDIIESHNLDIVKLANKYKDHEDSIFDATSVPISAAITAYGRIHISKIKLLIESQNMGGKVYYSDTDSIVTDIKLPEHMISPKDLGKLKLEHKIDKGIFISVKTYCLITDDQKVIIKAKGGGGKEEYS